MEKIKRGPQIIFCFLTISICFGLAIGIAEGTFFTKEKVFGFLNSKREFEESKHAKRFKGEETLLEDKRGDLEEVEEFNKKGKPIKKKQKDNTIQEAIEQFLSFVRSNGVLLSILFITMLILFLVFRRIQKKRQISNESVMKKTERDDDKKVHDETDEVVSFPANEIRAMLVNWERTLPKFEKRRLQETMQQWFSRIHKNNDIIPIYEKVRYGEGDASKEELQTMQRWVKENVKKSL
ncbi:hypothetical protein [Bacillus gaemokensis]|uniref:Signal peptidase II n=1 Tax=Bacillus gaemokensis TaxID=574375 RepID=A0A073K5U9_9BACI|nr:hypothetical protein [Bacillus gaemokensis]KEK22669.1 hypothetical protein BAGA_17020 [Bacillus gaemokensis]KYG28907.1 hypothetical protein AZF08_14410 [Bacillus gaemokensis]